MTRSQAERLARVTGGRIGSAGSIWYAEILHADGRVVRLMDATTSITYPTVGDAINGTRAEWVTCETSTDN